METDKGLIKVMINWMSGKCGEHKNRKHNGNEIKVLTECKPGFKRLTELDNPKQNFIYK